jgi:hypothetical protein
MDIVLADKVTTRQGATSQGSDASMLKIDRPTRNLLTTFMEILEPLIDFILLLNEVV